MKDVMTRDADEVLSRLGALGYLGALFGFVLVDLLHAVVVSFYSQP